MSDVNNIFYGPAQLSIWDSTNKELLLGYASRKVKVWEEPLGHKMIDGNFYPYTRRAKFQAELLESDPVKLNAIKAREGTKQEVFIIGANCVVKFTDVYVTAYQVRDYDHGKTHLLVLTAQTEIEDDCEMLHNLLSSYRDNTNYGNMDTDGSPSGISLGWSQSGLSAYSRTTPSFLGAGHGYHQNITPNGSGDVFYCNTYLPLNPVPITIRVKCWIFLTPPASGDIQFGIKTLDNAGSVLDTQLSSFTIPAGVSTECAATINFTPSDGVERVNPYFQYDGDTESFQIDEVIMTIGSQDWDYLEND